MSPEPASSQEGKGSEPKPTFTPRPSTDAANLPHIQRVLVVMSGKGGVGKSTVALNLALALRKQGLSVGLADLDITNPNTPRMTGLSEFHFNQAGGMSPPEVEGVSIASTQFLTPPGEALVWRGPMKQKMIAQLLSRVSWPRLDVLVADLPPGTGDEPLSVAQLLPNKAEAVLVTTPQTVATEDLQRSFAFTEKVGMPVAGVVENMSSFTCGCGREHDLFGSGGGRILAEELGVTFLGSVPIDPRIVEQGDAGKPIVLADPEAPAAQAFTAMADRIARAWEGEDEA
ncbi:MAG: Mrp/NBP35 family ATP-binding protein [Candidatus Thermoplasmatota archaeon]|nr:Mrp/NBP35 family ATP-binding protein [Candidatus Thermoplasmatota archaeon]